MRSPAAYIALRIMRYFRPCTASSSALTSVPLSTTGSRFCLRGTGSHSISTGRLSVTAYRKRSDERTWRIVSRDAPRFSTMWSRNRRTSSAPISAGERMKCAAKLRA